MANALVEMYAKCGSIRRAWKVFQTTVGFDGRVRRSRLQLRCSLALARKKGREVAGGGAGDLALFSEEVWREEEDRVVGASLV